MLSELELGEVVVEEILKEKRLGSKGFARIRINLLLELPFEVLFHCLSCYYLDSSFLEVLEIISFGVLEFRG